jgi:hypothetical protein
MLGDVFRKAAMPPERNGDSTDEPVDGPNRNGELTDDQGRGETSPAKIRAPRQRSRPVDDSEKGKGRNLKIPDSVFRRLELEALRRQTDNSKLVTKILDRELPKEIEMSFVIGGKKASADVGKKASADDDEKTPATDD